MLHDALASLRSKDAIAVPRILYKGEWLQKLK